MPPEMYKSLQLYTSNSIKYPLSMNTMFIFIKAVLIIICTDAAIILCAISVV